MENFQIPAALLEECHHLGSLGATEVLLSRNASLPWFILVPRTELQDFLDLPGDQRNAVLGECAAVSSFIKQVLGYDKVNFAGLGNVVHAMHLHIIGRDVGDACWPKPVWNNLPEGPTYSREDLLKWQADLVESIGLTAVSIPD